MLHASVIHHPASQYNVNVIEGEELHIENAYHGCIINAVITAVSLMLNLGDSNHQPLHCFSYVNSFQTIMWNASSACSQWLVKI
jgi:hypothetical protein